MKKTFKVFPIKVLSPCGKVSSKEGVKKRDRPHEHSVVSGCDFGLLKYLFVCAGLTVSLTLGGCAGLRLDEAREFNSIQEAASVHVSALSISRWDDYVNTLQPQFTMTPAQALVLALPRTSISQSSIGEILSGGLQIGLPQSTQSSSLIQALTRGLTSNTSDTSNAGTSTSSGTTTATGSTATTSTTTTTGNQTTTQTTTTQQGPGTLPPNLLPSSTLPNAAAVTAPSGTVQIDPILTYTAATAIYQEVQLLNAYVKDAVLRYGYVPYLARVQVSVIPFAHNEPYDVYVNLGIFSRCRHEDVEAPVIVIPLLVTDDVETGQTTNALNVARQLALSLGGIVGNVALQAGLSDLKDRFQAILGTDFNSLYMVSRGGDNVLQVRLGAARNPNLKVGYGMLTQTHNVSFLLLVDHDYSPDEGKCFTPKEGDDPLKAGPQVWITSFARFRYAITGKELPINKALLFEHAKKVMERFLTGDQAKNIEMEDIRPLLVAMQKVDMNLFKKRYCHLLHPKETNETLSCDEAGMAESLWTSLTTVYNMSEYAGTIFELPRRQRPPVEERQTVFLHDNCKETATAALSGFGSLSPSQFTAGLTLKNNVRLAAMAITQSTPGGPFTLQFPSLRPFTDHDAVKKACPPSSPEGVRNPDEDLTVAVQLDGAELTLDEIIDKRWDHKFTATDTPKKLTLANTKEEMLQAYDEALKQLEAQKGMELRPATKLEDKKPVNNFKFKSVYLDGSTQVKTHITLLPAVDTLTVDTNRKSQLRLFVTAKGLDDVVLSFSGANLVLPLPNNATQVEDASQPAASLKVTLATGSPTTVVDVSLQELVATRTVTITAVGRKKATVGGVLKPVPVAGEVSVITLPVIAPSSSKPTPGNPPGSGTL